MIPTPQDRNKIIIFASSNANKLQEIKAMLPHCSIHAPEDMGLTCTPDEHGHSFLENALIKAQEYYRALHNRNNDAATHSNASGNDIVFLSEDSGLCVEALQNRPGIHSARYGYNPELTPPAALQDNAEHDGHLLDTKHPLYQCQLLLNEMKTITNRKAKFICCAVLMWTPDNFLISQAEWHGEIIQGSPKGRNGFGYDPIFYLPDYKCTSAELPPEEKNSLSHRKAAISRFMNVL